MALFRMAFFRLFALVFRHFAWRISLFRLFAFRYFVVSLFRLAFFRYFVFSLGVISSWRRAITPGEKTKKRNDTNKPPYLTLKAPIATKVVCFSRLLKCLRSLFGKQCGPRSVCSYRSSLFWVHAVYFYA